MIGESVVGAGVRQQGALPVVLERDADAAEPVVREDEAAVDVVGVELVQRGQPVPWHPPGDAEG